MLEEGLAAARAPALAAPCAMSRSVGRRSPRILNCAPMGSRNTVRFSIAYGPAACIAIHSCASLNAIGIVDLINESFAHSVADLINFSGVGYELQGCSREALPKRATSGRNQLGKMGR
jgi:hypothetical protein